MLFSIGVCHSCYSYSQCFFFLFNFYLSVYLSDDSVTPLQGVEPGKGTDECNLRD